MPLPLVGKVKKGIVTTVGLGQEAYYHNKEKKEAASVAENEHSTALDQENRQYLPFDDPPDYSDIDNDEDDWLADEAQDHIRPATPEGQLGEEYPDADKTIRWFFSRHPDTPPTTASALQPLPAPVVIPQKRPNARSRGFVRAYAPALGDCGVDHAAFNDFLNGFDKSIAQQNTFNAVNIAVALSVLSYTASLGPSITVHLAATAVHASIEAGRRLYISKKENSYLDQMNDKYFRPRGLYALVMAYKPGNNNILTTVDFGTLSSAAVSKRAGEEKSSSFKASSGKTHDGELPEVCPLIYEDLDKADDEKKKNAFIRAFAFRNDYMDRRSHIEFTQQHGNSGIHMPDHEFKGSYGDPRNFQNSSLLGVLTNNKFDPRARRMERRNARRVAQGRAPRTMNRPKRQGLISRALGDNVLYIMVVNMPSDEELAAAKEAMENAKNVSMNW